MGGVCSSCKKMADSKKNQLPKRSTFKLFSFVNLLFVIQDYFPLKTRKFQSWQFLISVYEQQAVAIGGAICGVSCKAYVGM